MKTTMKTENIYNREFIAATHRAVGKTASEIMEVDMLGWVATLGGSGSDYFRSPSVSIEDGSTYIYVVGDEKSSTEDNYAVGDETSSTEDNFEAIIAKWDSKGDLVWQRKLGGSGDSQFHSSSVSIEDGSTYVYAVGYETSSTEGNTEALIAKWDSKGDLVWQRKLGGSSDDLFRYSSVSIEDGSTYVYAVGYETSSTGSNTEALIAKWDSQGDLVWQRKLGGSEDDLFISSSVSIEDSGTYVYAVGFELSSTGSEIKALVAKWDSKGDLVWQRKLGGSRDDYFHSCSVSIEDGSTYVYAVGYGTSSAVGYAALIAKWDSQGDLVWQRKLGGSMSDNFSSSSVSVEDGSTYVYAVGYDTSSTEGNSEALIAKWDSKGDLVWQRKLGGSEDDYFHSSSVSIEDGSAYVYAVGYETSSRGGESNYRALIAKWNASGRITQGTLAGIPQLSLADDNLTVGYPGLTTGNPGLTVGDPALTVGDPALTVGNPNLTRAYSAY